MTKTQELPSAIAEIAAERSRQVEAEGWSPEHDDKHDREQLARAAACYAVGDKLFVERTFQRAEWRDRVWPWSWEWWKPGPDRRRQLVKAGALIVAEIERLDRARSQSHD